MERQKALKITAPLIYGKSATEAVSAASILASVDERAKWMELLEAANVVAVAVVGEKERQPVTVPDWNTRRQALVPAAITHEAFSPEPKSLAKSYVFVAKCATSRRCKLLYIIEL